MPRTTSRHRRLRMSSGYVRSFLRQAAAFGKGNWNPLWSALSEWVSEWDLHAKIGSPFRAQARTTNDIYISSSTDFSERNKVIELINPKGRVVGTMSPISYLFVPAKRLNHWVPTVSRAANSSSMFWEPIQCSNNPSLSWQSGNIVSKFPILFQAHNRPCFQAMTSCQKFHSLIPMVKDFMPRQRPIHVTRWPNNGT